MRAPPFALGRLEQLAHDQLVYRFPKPQPDGRTELRLTPLELIERLAALIPPRACTVSIITGWQRTRHSVRRSLALARPPTPPACAPLPTGDLAQHAERSPARILWALLSARIYPILPLRCTLCGDEMRIIAFVTDPLAVKTILRYLGEPTTALELARARGPPLWDQASERRANRDDAPAPVPEFVFDQRVSG